MNKDISIKIIIGVSIFGIFWLINSYYISYIKAQYAELTVLQKELEIKKVLAEQDSVESLIKSIQDFAPNDLQRSELTATLSQYARETNMNLSRIDLSDGSGTSSVSDNVTSNLDENIAPSAQPITLVNTLNTGKLELSVSGGKKELYNFINKLKSSARYIEIDEFSMSVGENYGDISANINATVYYTKL